MSEYDVKPDVTVDPIRVACDGCGKRFKMPAGKAGKRGKCPGCGEVIVVPEAAPEGGEPAGGDFDWDSLASAESNAQVDEAGYAMAEPAAEAAPVPARPRGDALSQQMKSLTPAQRKALALKAERGAMKGSKAKDGDDQLWGFPSFLMGLTLAAAGALIGGLLWFWMLALTGSELRLLAIGIGVLAGGGMFAGYQKHDMGAAFLAAFLAGAGIVLAKLAMVTWGQGYLRANLAAEVTSEVEQAIEMEYDESALEKVSREEMEREAIAYKVDELRRVKGYDWSTWYNALDQWRDKQTRPIIAEIKAADDDMVRRLYIVETLRYDLEEEAVAAANARFREDNGLETEDEQWEEDRRLSALLYGDDTVHDDRQNARKELQRREKEREEIWAKFEPIEEETRLAVRQELEAMSSGEAVERYEAYRESTRETQLADAAALEEALTDMDDEEAEESEYRLTAFGFRDIFFVPLALMTAFGLGTGMRGDE